MLRGWVDGDLALYHRNLGLEIIQQLDGDPADHLA